jgi:hypothetical protein
MISQAANITWDETILWLRAVPHTDCDHAKQHLVSKEEQKQNVSYEVFKEGVRILQFATLQLRRHTIPLLTLLRGQEFAVSRVHDPSRQRFYAACASCYEGSVTHSIAATCCPPDIIRRNGQCTVQLIKFELCVLCAQFNAVSS